MLIKYYTRRIYGIDREYILDPEQAKRFLRLTGAKTLSQDIRETLAFFGLEFEEVLPPK